MHYLCEIMADIMCLGDLKAVKFHASPVSPVQNGFGEHEPLWITCPNGSYGAELRHSTSTSKPR